MKAIRSQPRPSGCWAQFAARVTRLVLGQARQGTTLSEVLISTLVMSIGVVALASLFPISVLRSIQASQLTNAANLRYNAEAQLRTVPELLQIGQVWQPATNYQVGDAVVPTLTTRLSAPPTVFVCTQAGTSGGQEPVWLYREGQTTPDGGVSWTTLTLGLAPYVVDPLGYLLVDPTDNDGRFRDVSNPVSLTGARQHFGNVEVSPGVVKPFKPLINRFPAFGAYLPNAPAAVNEFQAANLVVLPDSWTLQAESLDLANLTYNPSPAPGTTSIDLQNVDYRDLSQAVQVPTLGPDLVPDRIVFFDDTGRRSITRTIVATPTAAPQGTRIVCAPPLPTPLPFTPAKVRVESLERRYSYLLSVRRKAGRPAHVDVVVFFRRRYAVEDERVYSAVFRKIDRGEDGQPGVVGVDDNGTGGADDPVELGWPGSDDKPRNFVIVQYNSATEKPFFKKGGFVCDAHNLRWYRILDVYEDPWAALGTQAQRIARVTPAGFEQDPVDPAADRAVRLTLDQDVLEDSPFIPGSLTPQTTNGLVGGAILMRGIVDVFPLRPAQQTEE